MISIRVDTADFNRLIAAIGRVQAAVISQKQYIPLTAARGFRDLLRKNIDIQRFGDFGVPRPKDSRWKKNKPNVDKFWIWLGSVYKGIQYHRIAESGIRTAYAVDIKGGAVNYASGVPKRRAAAEKKTTKASVTTKPAKSRRATWSERMQKEYATGPVRHIDPLTGKYKD